jgi:hypothetical protein
MSDLTNGSASGLERMAACPPSLVLPRAHRTTEDADRGSTIHGFVRSVLTGMPVVRALALVEDAATRETCSRIDFRRLGGDLVDVRAEVAYAIDPIGRTAREIGVNVQREYARAAVDRGAALTEHEVPGSDDIEGRTIVGNIPTVLDVKTGWESVTLCAENYQMRFFAAAKSLLTGADVVECRIAYVRPDGDVDIDSATFTAFDVDVFLDEIETALLRVRQARRVFVAEGRVDVTAGPHCRYCASMSACPEYTALARAMLSDVERIDAQVAALTPAEMGQAWRKAKQVETLLDRVLDAMKAQARQAAIPLPDGKMLRPVTFERKSFSTSAALDLLKAKGATESEIAGCYRAAMVEQIKETAAPGAGRARKRSAA